MKLYDPPADSNSILPQAEASTWQGAVKLSMGLLVEADVVEPRYYQVILDGVEQFDPYFVITFNLAMSHGRPEERVRKTGFALVTLKSPLMSNHEDNDPVDILMTMAAVDANIHQEVGIMQIMDLFGDEANFDRLRACHTVQEVLDLIGNATAAVVQKDTKMSLPMLQTALDNQSMSSAYETTCLTAEGVNIIEVGTILYVTEGMRAVRDLKALYPYKVALVDARIADAGKVLSHVCFEANADWVTVICYVDINTTKGVLEVAKGFNDDVQTKLTGYWTWEQTQGWRDAGAGQVVYHRSCDAQAAGVTWGETDIGAIRRPPEMGFEVAVAGSLALEDPPMFQGVSIHILIAGRSIRGAVSPVEVIRQFKRSIAQLRG